MALEPVDIREVWPTVREGLVLVKESTNPPWIPEDIYAYCVAESVPVHGSRQDRKGVRCSSVAVLRV